MLGGFLPPVVFTITSNASQALASFGKVNTQLKIMDAQAKKTTASMLALRKGFVVAAAAGKAFAVILGAFAAYGVKETIELEKAYSRLGQTLAAIGESTDENRQRMADAAQGTEAFGFDAARASDALSILLQTTKDVGTSQKLLGLSMDLARARQMDLSTAAKLLARAQAGNNRIFTMFGITIDKTKSKTEATKEAMAKLSAVIGGQAEAYTKTFAGQVEVLGKQIENLAEGIGAALLPYLTKFLSIIQKLGKWLNEHRTILLSITFVVGTLLVAAFAKLIAKMSIAIGQWVVLNSKLILIIAAVMAVVAGFTYLWNTFEGFRKSIIGLGKLLVLFAETVVMAFQLALNVILLLVRGTANAQIALGKLFGDDEMIRRGKKTLDWIDSTNKSIEDFGNKLVDARKKLDKFKDTKIDLSKFKLPALEIPKFTNGDPLEEGIPNAIKEGLRKAKDAIKQFNYEMKREFEKATATWASIVNRDFVSEINDLVNNNVDDLVRQANAAVAAYEQVSRRYADAMNAVAGAQGALMGAIASGNTRAIASAQQALANAQDVAKEVSNAMNSALEDIKQIQDDIIKKVAELKLKIKELEKERTKVLEEAQAERLELESNYNKEVARLNKDYNLSVIKAQEDAARRSAEIVKQSVDQMRDVFRNATYRSLTDIYSSLTYEGRYLQGGSIKNILASLGLQAQKAETLASDAASLAGAGFSQTFIEEVLALGPDMGHSLAQTILNSTPESMAQLKSYWESLQTLSNHGVDDIATELNSGLTLATEELTQQLADVQTELNATLGALNTELQDNLTEAWTAYADALDEINKRTAAAIAEIDAQIAELQKTIQDLMDALAMLQNLPAPGGGGGTTQALTYSAEAHGFTSNEAYQLFRAMERGDPSAIQKIQNAYAAYNQATGYDPLKQANNVTISVTTAKDATSTQIANDVAWAFRTGSDVNFAGGL